MPVQSKRISLSALGIDSVRGMAQGNHLRIGFDPEMGFPLCGFELYHRRHMTGPRRQIDFIRLFSEKTPTLLRRGYSQDGVAVFHPGNPLPVQSAEGGVALTEQMLGISFRHSPFAPDSNPKVCEVRLRFRARGSVVVEAFDDRYENGSFPKRLVAREQGVGSVFDPGILDGILDRLYRGWTGAADGLLGVLDTSIPVATGVREETIPEPRRASLDEILATSPDLANDPQLRSLSRRTFPDLAEAETVGNAAPVPSHEGRPLVAGVMRLNRFVSNSVFNRALRRWGGEFEIVLRADLISLVEIRAPAGARLLGIEYVEVIDDAWSRLRLPAEAAWGVHRETPLLLPTPQPVSAATSTYPTCQALVFEKSATAIAEELPVQRLSPGFVARSGAADIHGEYDDLKTLLAVYLGPDPERLRFQELDNALRAIEAEPPSQQLQLTVTYPSDAGDDPSSFAPLPMILSGAVDPNFARLVGLAAIDSSPSPGSHLDYKVVARWNNGYYAWITHDVFPGRDGKLNQPEAAAAQPVLDATRPGDVKTNVELTWHRPDEIARLNRANQHVGYLLFRRRVDPVEAQQRLTESNDELTGVKTPDLLLVAEVQGDEPTPPSEPDGAHYVDRPPAYTVYDYGLQAQDLFGRRSEIAWTNGVTVPVLVVPRPVGDLYAFHLDTEDPAQLELEPRAARVIEVTGEAAFSGRALLIEFRYPLSSRDAVAGDVAAFDVLYRHGRPNELVGVLSTPTIVGPVPSQATSPVLADVELATATPVPVLIDGFGGERSRGALASHGEFFTVETATRVSNNLVRLRVRARRDYLPQPGLGTLSLGAGAPGVSPHPSFASPRDPSTWSGFDLRQPRDDANQGPLRMSSTAGAVLGPLPSGLTATQVAVSRTIELPVNLLPGDPVTPIDWVYRIVIEDFDLPLPAGLMEYAGAITVQVVSGAGHRSELPAPAFARRCAHDVPPAIDALATSEFVIATRPDFEGRIGVWLSWPRIPGVQRFNVYRADVAKLLNFRNESLQLAENLLEDTTRRAEIKLRGGELASVDAFTLVTPIPIEPEIDPSDPNRHRWVDRVAAPREQNYVYRVQPIGANGVFAPWPADSSVENENRDRCILVLQRNRDLLLTPAIYELEPLDRGVGVVVRRPLSPTVVGLRIYKTDQPSLAGDVRRMTLIHGTIPLSHPRIESLAATNGTPARLRFLDEKARVGVQYFYRVAFVDEFGNVSMASEPMAVTPRSFAPPSPPVLTAQRVAAGTVNLSWVADHAEGEIKVQRKRSGGSQWLDLAPDWLAPTGVAVDLDAAGVVAHRVVLRDSKGRLVYSETVITEV